ncbi:sodium-dependent proline transporter isoform X1 [Leptinotarsa decemlineata]|uniref:sodium-dependent proline transporter isoform X1 n=1 Tax=Leptinotarsa decemlineata TaxID=7539 RepID=UPI003D304542
MYNETLCIRNTYMTMTFCQKQKNAIIMSDNTSENNIPVSGWKSNKFYIMALISWTSGLVNVYHTPRFFLRGTFLDLLIAYIFLMIVMGIPLMQMELTLSQYSRKSVVGSWDLCPLFRGIGYTKAVTIFIFQLYYNAVNSYILLYCFCAIPKYESLEKCDMNGSNASHCFNVHFNGSVERAQYGSHAEKFWFKEILNVDRDNKLSDPHWKLVGCLCATMTVIFLATSKGLESLKKIISLSFVVSSIEMVIFLYVVTLMPGSLRGIKNFITINFNFDKLAPWRRESATFLSFQMMFYSLGIGLGGFSSIAAESNFRAPSHEYPIWINLTNFGHTIIHSFFMANLYGIVSYHTREDIERVKDTVRTNPDFSYIFMIIPNALSSMPGHPQVWQFIIFSSLYLRGLSCSILMAYTVLQIVYEIRPTLKRYSWICSLAFTGIICFPGWVLHTTTGFKLSTFINDITYTTLLPVINTVQVIAVVFFYHIFHLADDLYFMLGFPPSNYFQLSLVFTSFLLPMFTVISLVRYFEETHSEMTIIMQKSILSIVLIWIPFMAMVRIIRKRKWAIIISPSSKWGPPDELKESRKIFSEVHSIEEYMYEKYLRKNKLRKYK